MKYQRSRFTGGFVDREFEVRLDDCCALGDVNPDESHTNGLNRFGDSRIVYQLQVTRGQVHAAIG